jgi:hypothetical protein
MSRNFELLTELQADFRIGTAAVEDLHVEVKPIAPARQDAPRQELWGLVQTVFLPANGSGCHEVVLCGVDDNEGSSVLCADLGRILSAHALVCLIDGNPGVSHLKRILAVGPSVSVSDPDGCQSVAPNLWYTDINSILTGSIGMSAPGSLKQRLTELRSRFAFILVQAPGVNARGDAGVLGGIVDGAILVIDANSTRKAAAIKAKRALMEMNVRILGSVLMNRTFPIPEGLYRRL